MPADNLIALYGMTALVCFALNFMWLIAVAIVPGLTAIATAGLRAGRWLGLED
jgi:precorrin-3B methylase